MININRLAAIDIGSNSVKLLISDMINYQGRIVSKKFAHTRMPLQLGDDTFHLGYITDTKKDKLAQLVQTFASFVDISGAEHYRICATSALREASNKQEIIDYVYATVGVQIELITHQDEANFIFLNGVDDEFNSDTIYIMADVGGGCTQIAVSQGDILIESESFNLGTLRNLSRQEEHDEYARLKNWLEEKRDNHRDICLVGSGGNINKINSLFNKRGKIKRLDLKYYYRKLSEMNLEERVVKSDFGFNRGEVIIPAIKIYLQIMKILKVEVIQIPMIGIADGIIKDMYLKKYLLHG